VRDLDQGSSWSRQIWTMIENGNCTVLFSGRLELGALADDLSELGQSVIRKDRKA
jgi:hypothetical protein